MLITRGTPVREILFLSFENIVFAIRDQILKYIHLPT